MWTGESFLKVFTHVEAINIYSFLRKSVHIKSVRIKLRILYIPLRTKFSCSEAHGENSCPCFYTSAANFYSKNELINFHYFSSEYGRIF